MQILIVGAMSIGKRLDEFANEMYGSVTGLSKKLRQVSDKKTSIYKYVNDERSPGTSVLIPLARLGMNLNWLLTGEGEMLVKNVNKSKIDTLEYDNIKSQGQIQILKEMIRETSLGK